MCSVEIQLEVTCKTQNNDGKRWTKDDFLQKMATTNWNAPEVIFNFTSHRDGNLVASEQRAGTCAIGGNCDMTVAPLF